MLGGCAACRTRALCAVALWVVALSGVTCSDALTQARTERVTSTTVLRAVGSFAIHQPIGLASLTDFGLCVERRL